MPALLKYAGEGQGTLHPDRLTWPGGPSGLPLLGTPPGPLKQQEFNKISRVGQFCCDMFDMGDEKQKARFVEIMDRATNKWFHVHRRIDLLPDAANPSLRIWLEWVQCYEMAQRQTNYLGPPRK